MPVQPGEPLPPFSLPAVTKDGETTLSLDDFRGRKLVLYFYPKDDTPGCTKEACGFRDLTPDFEAKGAAIVGISTDPVKSHLKFRDKYALPFPLLSDADHAYSEKVGVWKDKSMYGRSFKAVERTTILADENGIVLKVWPKVKVDGHLDAVLAAFSG
jgi:peroxiredoxin Q/BCP